MRVTQTMLSNNMLRNLSSSYDRLGKLMEQASSQKKINRPSDDPVVAMLGMSYRTDLNQITQFQRNIGEVKNWVDTTDSALDSGVKALQRIRELTVRASTGSMDKEEHEAMAQEIEQLKETLLNLADTQIGGKYIFNGTKTDQRPSESFDAAGDLIMSTDPIELEVFPGIKLPLNINGEALFGQYISGTKINYGDTIGLIESTDLTYDDVYAEAVGPIHALITKLSDPDFDPTDKDIDGYLDDLDQEIDTFIRARATVGAKQNRVELMEDRIGQQEVFSTRIMAENESVDIERVITELITQESIHRAALGIGARIVQPSLMDFLR